MKKKQTLSLIVLIIGLITLIIGVVFLILDLTRTPAVADGEYLVEIGSWTLENDENSENNENVIWTFTEIGKGTLTTNNHTNDYDFIWALEDGKLKIETKWLYDLENEYEYRLDQEAKILTLTNDEKEFKFSSHFENNE